MTTVQTKSRVRSSIDDTTAATRLHGLKTLPLAPEYAQITLYAGEIIPHLENEDESYLTACRQHNVIPYSRTTLEYRNGGFQPQSSNNPIVEKTIEETTETLIKGGRLAKIMLELSYPAAKGFAALREQTGLLADLTRANYEVSRGIIWLSHRRFTGYNEGESMCSGIILGREIELRNRDIEGEKQIQIMKWFRNLKRHHRNQQK